LVLYKERVGKYKVVLSQQSMADTATHKNG
jgi:hypothetical protein